MRIKKIFGIEKNVFMLGLVSFFNDFSSEMILSIFPAFFESVLKSGAASLGVIEGVADGFSNFIKIYSGRLSDKIQKRKILAVVGYGISVATRPFYLLVTAPAHVLGIRITDRIGKGFREAPRDALISLSAPEDELGKSFGYHRAMDTLGAIAGPLTAFVILREFPGHWNTLFITAFIVGLCAIGSFVFVHEVTGIVKKTRLNLAWKGYPRHFVLFLVSISILSIGNIPMAVLLLRTQDLGLDVSYIPLFYLFYNVSFAIFAFSAGKVADAVGDRKVIFIGYLLLSMSYAFIIYDDSLSALAIGFVVLGLFSALTDGIQRSYIARIVPEEHRGSAFGYLNAAIGFGSIIAGVMGGLLWQNYGPIFALSTASVIIVAGLLVLIAARDNV